MKKFAKLSAIVLGAVLVLSTNAFAKRSYGLAGCGLGSIAFGDSEMVSAQIMAATTNGSTGNQAFGISSGTSGCTADDDVAAAPTVERIQYFVDANHSSLIKEAARGEGETLASLSTLVGCQNTKVLGQAMKANYKKVFKNDTQATAQNIVDMIKNDQNLAQACSQDII